MNQEIETPEGKRLYVGNLDYEVSDRELRDAFAAHVGVEAAEVMRDKHTGASRGFGFIELMMASDAPTAIAKLNGLELRGRAVTVQVANPKPPVRAPRPRPAIPRGALQPGHERKDYRRY